MPTNGRRFACGARVSYLAPLLMHATNTTWAMIVGGRRRDCGSCGASGASSADSTAHREVAGGRRDEQWERSS